jgi:RNA polymerase sigma-70 factor (ECF subfamily)
MRSQVGDDDKLAKLFENEAAGLVGYLLARGMQRPEAEDVVQDTFLVVWRKGREVIDHPNPTAYLYTIARRVVQDRRRADESRGRNEARWQGRRGGSTSAPPPELARLVDVDRALLMLTQRQREVVYLHRCADMKLGDVADVLSLKIGTVKSHLRRAEARLRLVLGDPPGGHA